MHITLIIFVYLLLLLSAFFIKGKLKTHEILKITFFYLLIFISYRVHSIYIPIGIIIGFLICLKVKKDKQLIAITLIYALLVYGVANYLTPRVPLKYMSETMNIYEYTNKFNDVEYVKTYSPSEHIQNDIKEFLDKETDINYFMLVSYILLDNEIQINSTENLISTPYERNIIGQRIQKDEKKDVIYLDYNGQDYLGVFETFEGTTNLKLIIKGSMKK